jgi:hypothetical protein
MYAAPPKSHHNPWLWIMPILWIMSGLVYARALLWTLTISVFCAPQNGAAWLLMGSVYVSIPLTVICWFRSLKLGRQRAYGWSVLYLVIPALYYIVLIIMNLLLKDVRTMCA